MVQGDFWADWKSSLEMGIHYKGGGSFPSLLTAATKSKYAIQLGQYFQNFCEDMCKRCLNARSSLSQITCSLKMSPIKIELTL
jgi:hypothetical protein